MSTRRIVWIDSTEFCGFVCAACSWKYAIPGLHNSDGLPIEVARSRFDTHKCADYWINTATLVAALETVITKLNTVVTRCRTDQQRTPLLAESTALQSAASECDQIKTSLSELLKGISQR